MTNGERQFEGNVWLPGLDSNCRSQPLSRRELSDRPEHAFEHLLAGASFVAHMGDHLGEYALDVLQGWVGDVALAADQIILGVQVGVIPAERTLAGETGKGSIEGGHV